MANALPFKLKRWDKKLDYFEKNINLHDVIKHLPERYIVVCPVGKQTFAANRKEWGFENFQYLVNLIKDIPIVQIGSPRDPLLKGVIDLRAIAFPIRTCATVIKKSLTGVFLEGGLMHLANAVGKPSIIIFGGALMPETTGYDCHINIATTIECGPCFTSDRRVSTCSHMNCMKPITPKFVFEHLLIKISQVLN